MMSLLFPYNKSRVRFPVKPKETILYIGYQQNLLDYKEVFFGLQSWQVGDKAWHKILEQKATKYLIVGKKEDEQSMTLPTVLLSYVNVRYIILVDITTYLWSKIVTTVDYVHKKWNCALLKIFV